MEIALSSKTKTKQNKKTKTTIIKNKENFKSSQETMVKSRPRNGPRI